MNGYSKITAFYSRLSVGNGDRDSGKRHTAYCSEYHKGKARNPKCHSPHIMDADLPMQTVGDVLKKITEYSISNRADFEALVEKSLGVQQADRAKKQQKRKERTKRLCRRLSGGRKITNEFDGETHGYTSKGGVAHMEILLPDHAPAEYADREVLWNKVEKIEKAKNAQLAREIEISLPRELAGEQGISLVREYVKRHFMAAGMCANVCLQDTGGNPHAHIMLTVRPFDGCGEWGAKQKKSAFYVRSGYPDGQGTSSIFPIGSEKIPTLKPLAV